VTTDDLAELVSGTALCRGLGRQPHDRPATRPGSRRRQATVNLITLVAIGESAIDQRLNVLRARLGLLCHGAVLKHALSAQPGCQALLNAESAVVSLTRGAGFSLGKRITVAGSVDADRRAEGLADRSVEDEVGDWVEAGWLAVYDYQCCAVVFRQFRERGGGINHQ
jgi:hypothetical protein